MARTTPRPLLEVTSEWPIAQVLEHLQAALDSTGPALAFAPSRFKEVSEDIAVVIPTSGSTGAPKEVALSAAALRASARAAHLFLGAELGERWSLLLPINHIAGVNVLVRSLQLQAPLVDLRKASRSSDYKNAHFTSVVPTQLFRALNGDAALLAHLKSARAVLVGGAATPIHLLSAAISQNINIVTTYGMSEMSGGCVYNNEALSDVEFRIMNDGRIALRGPMRASGYLGNEKAWNDSISQGWFVTSDIGEIRDEKLYIQGRIDDQIISGGEKISLVAIESELQSTFPGARFMCAGIADAEWGTALCVAIQGEIRQEDIRTRLVERFGAHVSPKRYMNLQELPFTELGKPDRARLQALFIRQDKVRR